MKCSKHAILARLHKLPRLRFEDQQLTSFVGTIVFQLLFQRLNLKARLKQCFPVKSIRNRNQIAGGKMDYNTFTLTLHKSA